MILHLHVEIQSDGVFAVALDSDQPKEFVGVGNDLLSAIEDWVYRNDDTINQIEDELMEPQD